MTYFWPTLWIFIFTVSEIFNSPYQNFGAPLQKVNVAYHRDICHLKIFDQIKSSLKFMLHCCRPILWVVWVYWYKWYMVAILMYIDPTDLKPIYQINNIHIHDTSSPTFHLHTCKIIKFCFAGNEWALYYYANINNP